MKQFEKCTVVMLPTKNKSKILRNTYIFPEHKSNPLVYGEIDQAEERGYEYQHLCFLSNAMVKKDDWFLVENRPQQCLGIINGMIHFHDERGSRICPHKFQPKIITSTDPVLNLPKPSQEFMKKFCEKGGIWKVLIKQVVRPISKRAKKVIGDIQFILDSQSTIPDFYYLKTEDGKITNSYGNGFELDVDIELVPKLNNKGEVFIKSVKTSYSEEEMIELMRKAWNAKDIEYQKHENRSKHIHFLEWLETNF